MLHRTTRPRSPRSHRIAAAGLTAASALVLLPAAVASADTAPSAPSQTSHTFDVTYSQQYGTPAKFGVSINNVPASDMPGLTIGALAPHYYGLIACNDGTSYVSPTFGGGMEKVGDPATGLQFHVSLNVPDSSACTVSILTDLPGRRTYVQSAHQLVVNPFSHQQYNSVEFGVVTETAAGGL